MSQCMVYQIILGHHIPGVNTFGVTNRVIVFTGKAVYVGAYCVVALGPTTRPHALRRVGDPGRYGKMSANTMNDLCWVPP